MSHQAAHARHQQAGTTQLDTEILERITSHSVLFFHVDKSFQDLFRIALTRELDGAGAFVGEVVGAVGWPGRRLRLGAPRNVRAC